MTGRGNDGSEGLCIGLTGVRFCLTANIGLLITDGTVCLVVDSLFRHGHRYGLSQLSEARLCDLVNGRPPFGAVDAFLSTHLHPDHGEVDVMARVSDPGIPLLFPATRRFEKEIPALRNPVTLFTGGVRSVWVKDVKVTAAETIHAGDERFAVEHVSYLIEFPARPAPTDCGARPEAGISARPEAGSRGARLFIFGDAWTGDPALMRFCEACVAGGQVDAAFVNYPELARTNGIDVLEALRPARCFAVHLNYPEEDTERRVALTNRRIARILDRGRMPGTREIAVLNRPFCWGEV